MISNQHPTYMQLSKQGPNVIIRFNDLTHYPTYHKELEVRCNITKLIRTYLKYIHYILLMIQYLSASPPISNIIKERYLNRVIL